MLRKCALVLGGSCLLGQYNPNQMIAVFPDVVEKEALRRRLEETTRDLAAARAGFDQTADRDLLEYYLYEISALGAKHTYLLRQMKSLGLEDSPGP